MAKLFIIKSLFALCAILVSGVESELRGGHITWRPQENNEILIDYTVFFDFTGEEARQCTDQAISDRELISTDISLSSWSARGSYELSKDQTKEIAKISFYCKLRDDISRRIVGEFKGMKYNSGDAFFYIGFFDIATSNGVKFATLVDLTPREDIKIVNTPPVTQVFPVYNVENNADKKIQIHAVDENDDFIRCSFAGTNNRFNRNYFTLDNCQLTIRSGTGIGRYTVSIMVTDFQKEHTNPFSTVAVQFEVFVTSPISDSAKLRFLPLSKGGSCYSIEESQPWESKLLILKAPEDRLDRLQMLGPDGASYIMTSASTRTVATIKWKPKSDQKGKHLMCFKISNQYRRFSEPKCLYLHVGSDFQMKTEYLYPKHNGFVPPSFHAFEIKVHGAFSQYRRQAMFNIYRSEDRQIEYQVDLSDPKLYSVTSDNRILIRLTKKLEIGKRYYVIATEGLFESQSKCMDAPKIGRFGEWSFTVRNDPGSYKHFLQCNNDYMRFFLNPRFYPGKTIEKVTLDYEFCKVSLNRSQNLYETTTPYDQCGTYIKEDDHYVIYNNIAKVYFKEDGSDNGNSLITRIDFVHIGLECRMLKSSVKTLKGKREDGGLIVGQQYVKVSDRAKGIGSFRIDFQVYKSMRYNYSYGHEEFPISVPISNRIYFELALNKDDVRLVPHNCYATKERSFQSQPRYYIIQDRCPKDNTFKRHRHTNKLFQFSIQAFNFRDGSDSIHVHCETYICKNGDHEKCKFGCNSNANSNRKRRERRGIEVKEVSELEGFTTSTLAIQIQNENVIYGTIEQQPSPQGTESSITYFYYLQIPIAVLIIAAAWVTWSAIKRRRNRTGGIKAKIVDDETH